MVIDYSLIQDWYGSVIPKRFTYEKMVEFCYRSNQFLRVVNRLHTSFLKMVKESPTAYTDGLDCYLPALFFEPSFYEHLGIFNEKEKILACLAIVNGCQIHESLHIEILGNNCDIRSLVKRFNWLANYDSQEFFTIFNIVEDQFSENWFINKNPVYGQFLKLLQKIMFNPKVFEQAAQGYIQATKHNASPISLNQIKLNLLVCYRNSDNIEFTDYVMKDAVNILYQANNPHLTLEQRLEIAIELFNLLIDKNNLEKIDCSLEAGKISKIPFESQVLNSKVLEQLVREKREILQKIEAFTEQFLNDQIEVYTINYQDVRDEMPDYQVASVTNYQRFCDYLRFAKSLNLMPAMPLDRGSRIDNRLIHRIATDSKIFPIRNVEERTDGEPEIIIMIDLSFSMAGQLLVETIEASKAIFDSLFKAGLAVAVYGHTTDGNGAIVYGIASNNMPLSNPDRIETTYDYNERFNKVTGVSNHSNADGWVIQFLTSRFSKRNNGKALIVLSDGRPSAGNYGSIGALEHCKNTVKRLRESNISVVSLSLTEDVVASNNSIYGKDFNVEAFGTKLEENFKKVVGRIIQR